MFLPDVYKRQDVDRFTSFEGDTGPYILYTIVRIKSILAKYQEQGGSLDKVQLAPAISPDEKALMMEIAKFNTCLLYTSCAGISA